MKIIHSKFSKLVSFLFLVGSLFPTLIFAEEGATESAFSSGDTAWILVATALVLFMTLPGLSMFYAGLVRQKNVLSVFMHCFAITAVMTIIWILGGYSLSFADGGDTNAYIGSMEKFLLSGIDSSDLSGSIPEILFAAFQMTFFIITPALIVGAFVERMKFSAMLIFVSLWAIIVYLPTCHMTWGGGLFSEWGVLDFAGGIVVHITAGVSALVACIMVGARKGFPKTPMPPHNLPMTVIGTGMLWVGWYGFNAGSALAADGSAATALLVTHISAAVASIVWMLIEWLKNGKPSVLGIATGSIAGLAAITPASGFVGPIGAFVIGASSAVVCYSFCTVIKMSLKYDDSLDVFGVHGIGGLVGTLLVSFFASEKFGGNQGAIDMVSQFFIQSKAALIIALYSAVVSMVLLYLIKNTIGIRVSEKEETEGLDLSSHEESGYSSNS